MRHALLVGAEDSFSGVVKEEFSKAGFGITVADSCGKAIEILHGQSFDLVLVDEKLSDGEGLECIARMVRADPFLNCAAFTSLSPDDFHEVSEGLGVLMGISRSPGKDDVRMLLEYLDKVTRRMNPKG